ncbi:PREDICTED: U-box domain-containing protein 30-like [Camelina sativa]|uniref:U-box domain-containing protein n=1 Tax=Camelina sativa TaxID=90675 RepID=A0ABM0TTL3_CAMSA|nr:PREDICTED: U-box domain-containing protein 30-like [Camelina sativa]
MRMFQPLKREGLIGFESGGDGQVLDLDTAVKDGVLGGVNGGGGVVDEKLDMKTMLKELDLQDIPSVFICPISLEPMQDPVTLCTGQTYERSNIHKWFNLGHLTCPTTMQELWDDTVTPNKTLHHLIYTWFSQKYVLMKKRSEDVQGRAIEVLGTLKKAKGQASVHALSKIEAVERLSKVEDENSLIWWPPEPILELARLVVDSGGDPGSIQRVLDPKMILFLASSSSGFLEGAKDGRVLVLDRVGVADLAEPLDDLEVEALVVTGLVVEVVGVIDLLVGVEGLLADLELPEDDGRLSPATEEELVWDLLWFTETISSRLS